MLTSSRATSTSARRRSRTALAPVGRLGRPPRCRRSPRASSQPVAEQRVVVGHQHAHHGRSSGASQGQRQRQHGAYRGCRRPAPAVDGALAAELGGPFAHRGQPDSAGRTRRTIPTPSSSTPSSSEAAGAASRPARGGRRRACARSSAPPGRSGRRRPRPRRAAGGSGASARTSTAQRRAQLVGPLADRPDQAELVQGRRAQARRPARGRRRRRRAGRARGCRARRRPRRGRGRRRSAAVARLQPGRRRGSARGRRAGRAAAGGVPPRARAPAAPAPPGAPRPPRRRPSVSWTPWIELPSWWARSESSARSAAGSGRRSSYPTSSRPTCSPRCSTGTLSCPVGRTPLSAAIGKSPSAPMPTATQGTRSDRPHRVDQPGRDLLARHALAQPPAQLGQRRVGLGPQAVDQPPGPLLQPRAQRAEQHRDDRDRDQWRELVPAPVDEQTQPGDDARGSRR